MSQLTVNTNLLDNVVQFVEVASLTTKRALDEVAVHRQAQEKAAALRPQLLEHMVKNKVVPAAQKQAAEVMLGAQDTTLQLLKAAVDKIVELNGHLAVARGEKKAGDLGSASDDPNGGGRSSTGNDGEYNSLTSPMVGEKTANLKESDKALLKLIGR